MQIATQSPAREMRGKGRLLPDRPPVNSDSHWRVTLDWPEGIEMVEVDFLPKARRIYGRAYRMLATKKAARYHLKLERVKRGHDPVIRNEERQEW
jgi:hypothetical protein